AVCDDRRAGEPLHCILREPVGLGSIAHRRGVLQGLLVEVRLVKNDLRTCLGAIVLDKDLGLRTQRIYQVSGHEPKTGAIISGSFHGGSSWDVFERYQQASMEPPPALVLDYDQ